MTDKRIHHSFCIEHLTGDRVVRDNLLANDPWIIDLCSKQIEDKSINQVAQLMLTD